MATLPTLLPGVSAYVAAPDLTSITVPRDGRLVVMRNPAGAAVARISAALVDGGRMWSILNGLVSAEMEALKVMAAYGGKGSRRRI